ncbi:hypothetical protein CPC735_067760 [Coccidioides posadasii C735 delta SOWgp]|uniref:DUF7587 domain-containing protein n=1 Tax=Coccidioides posadasii (strain C735) TaxID=222929 RepID=C5PCJ9_COCP7|nr:hypothetical protein CPC735_067760 [Coccidioides posadasii C735 delta SOWgp]EER25676.1 hypothetical protein CPC735_067760 [Coccidioides posadasii C735 delta SOWgp]|eukprot:XP_003067821.1 hypothetical protein CPC735_067760 [Coccidioides posadasii C735 delta SOWgp]
MVAESFQKQSALALLGGKMNPFCEEFEHSWAETSASTPVGPLLRVWDPWSGSQPAKSGRMQARSPRKPLDLRESRKESLAIHADYKIWEPTPFISFTSSIEGLERLISKRHWPESTARTLTVVNPNARLAKGLPIVEMKSELEYYNIPDRYGCSYNYYRDEYLCLWEITPEEVVQHWNWDELCENPRWYEDEIQPAFNQHNCHLLGRKPNHSAFNMSMLHDALPSVAQTVEMESPRMETPEMKMPVLEDA